MIAGSSGVALSDFSAVSPAVLSIAALLSLVLGINNLCSPQLLMLAFHVRGRPDGWQEVNNELAKKVPAREQSGEHTVTITWVP